MEPCGATLPQEWWGELGPGTEGAWLLNSCSGNNGAVALATRGGLSLGLKAESGNRCPKKGRLGMEGVGGVPVVRAI